MPGTVLAAAILLGIFGGFAGLGVVAYGAARLEVGGESYIAVGVVALTLLFVVIVGFVYRNRVAQIVAVAAGMIGTLAGIGQLMAVNPVGILWLGLSLAVMLLLAAPMDARMWFTR